MLFPAKGVETQRSSKSDFKQLFYNNRIAKLTIFQRINKESFVNL